MTDYDITDWTDFVRNVTPSARRDELQRHLDEGCQECAATVQFLQRVVAASPRKTVPDDLVTAAQSVFVREASEPRRSWLELPRIAARLVYNSLMDPLPEGARAAAPGAVHLMYEAGQYSVDVRLECETETAEVVLVGQIASRNDPEQPSKGIPVALQAGLKIVAETVTNEFGEFSLVYRHRPHLRLSIPVEAERSRLEIELNDVLAEEE